MKFILALFFLFSAQAHAQSTELSGPLKSYWQQIQSKTKIEDALRELPPELKNNVTFIYKSRSQQGSTYEMPRAITFSDSSDLIVTFNGSHSQKGGSDLEVMQFLDSNPKDLTSPAAHFELYSIHFDQNGVNLPVLSRKNPVNCASCHSEDPKPIWSLYGTDSGIYGTSYRGIGLEGGSKDQTQFLKFKSAAISDPRYGVLAWQRPSSSPQDKYWPFFSDDALISNIGILSVEPNIRLNIGLAANRAVAIADDLVRQKLFQLMPYTFMRSQWCSFEKNEANEIYDWTKKIFGPNAPRPFSSRLAAGSLYETRVGEEDYSDFAHFEFGGLNMFAFKPSHFRALFGFQAGDFSNSSRESLVIGPLVNKSGSDQDYQIFDRYLDTYTNTGWYFSISAMVTERLLYLLEQKPLIGHLFDVQKLDYNFDHEFFSKSKALVHRLEVLNVAVAKDDELKKCDLYKEKSELEIENLHNVRRESMAGQVALFNSVVNPLLEEQKLEKLGANEAPRRFGCVECHSDLPIGPKINFDKLDPLDTPDVVKRINSTDITEIMPRGRPPLNDIEKKNLMDYIKAHQ